ncbi:hypothetical protein [uncultured Arcobacter sp.]|uniref:hypothetical protein n=1 Tax=uncultured Arcobacter sp. TaxID=165434 RepID=UPI00261BB7D2|nr:hypothetical protein [uncultured Arcobacter sp.]
MDKTTQMIFENFADINNSMIVDEPNTLKTGHADDKIFGAYDHEENFPFMAFYNLKEFLGLIKMGDGVEYLEDSVVITNTATKSSIRYYYSDSRLINFLRDRKTNEVKPSENIKKHKADVIATFVFEESQIKEMMKISSVMKLKKVNINIKDGKGIIRAYADGKNDNIKFDIVGDFDGECDFTTAPEVFKIINGTYKCEVTSKYMKLIHKDIPLVYKVPRFKV